MAYADGNGSRRFDRPNGAVRNCENPCQEWQEENGETYLSGHEYADVICPHCGRDVCYSCARTRQGSGSDGNMYFDCPDCGQEFTD